MLALQQKKPSNSTNSSISLQFFSKVPELAVIEQPFNLSTIDHQLAVRDLDNQFQLLRAITQTKKHKLRLRSNTVLENKKNRYPEQSIFEHSRVHLTNKIQISKKQDPESIEEKKKNFKNEYINANIIFSQEKENPQNITIISQAPLQETTEDFIKMIVQNQISCVVMLCNVIENGKNRCYDYLNQTNLYESVESLPVDSVLKTKKQLQTGLEIRKIKVKFSEGQTGKNEKFHQFYHILFTEWPDKSVPDNPELIQPILDLATKHSKIVIHCSAGLGRSGVVAALFKIIKSFQNEIGQQKNPSEQSVSVFRAVRQMREDRYGAVQNNQQYRFIYEYLRFHNNMKNQKG